MDCAQALSKDCVQTEDKHRDQNSFKVELRDGFDIW